MSFDNLMMLIVHMAAAVIAFWMIRGAPGWIQRIIVGAFGVAMSLAALGFGGAALGFDTSECSPTGELFRLALRIEHWIVLLFIFRLYYERHVKWTSSPHYRS